MKYPCDVIKDLMPLYADGICSEESRKAVDEHCSECLPCRTRLDDMLSEIPNKNGSIKTPPGFVNPIKKIVGRRVKFIVASLLICSLIAAASIKAVILTVNENNCVDGESWSTLKAERYIRKFAKKYKNGRYLEALETVDILTDGTNTLTDDEQTAIYQEYAKACERFFSDHPVISYSTECKAGSFNMTGHSGGSINADIKFKVRSPNNNPVYAVMQFVVYKNDGGLEYDLDRTYITSDDFHDYSKEELGKYSVDLNNVTVAFPEFDYLGNCNFGSGFASFLESGDYYGASLFLDTTEIQKLREMGSRDIVYQYLSYGGSLSVYYSPERFRLADGMGIDKEIEEAEKDTENRLGILFSEKYKFVSMEYDSPYFSDEILYKETILNQHGAFGQNIKINMNDSGNEFSVSFGVLLHDRCAVLPAQNIVYSENTPEGFKKDFEDIFTK